MYAVIETGGKQYRVEQGDVIFIEKLDIEEGQKVVFDKVMMVCTDEGIVTGAPYVEGAKVAATVEKNGKARKIAVFTYRSKKGSKRALGHRQPYTRVQIDGINTAK